MKFTVSYSRKVKAGRTYEMMEIFASIESDTSIETMDVALERVKYLVNQNIEKEQDRLLAETGQRPKGEREAKVDA